MVIVVEVVLGREGMVGRLLVGVLFVIHWGWPVAECWA